MSHDRISLDAWGAGALILGSIIYIALMAVHPSQVGPSVLGHLSLSGLVHGAGLFINPILAFGFIVLAQRLGLGRPLPLLGLVFYLFSAIMVMLAGTMSGLVIPEVIEAMREPPRRLAAAVSDPQTRETLLRALAAYTVWLNRSFAQVYVGLFSLAMMAWSIAWPVQKSSDWVVRLLGLALGAGVLGWQLSGNLAMNAQHDALVVTLAHSLWTILAASLLLRPR